MTWLLDGNVLTALVLKGHVHHGRVRSWLEPLDHPFATCSVTQGTLLRLHMMHAVDHSAEAAWRSLRAIAEDAAHVFWDDGFNYLSVSPRRIQGHRQVTDAWLVHLARKHQGRLATLDGGLVAVHPDVGFLVPII